VTRMDDQITIETDAFEHRELKPHFINPCCFGEDLAAWLKQRLAFLGTSGFEISDPIQEDYGWGLWVTKGSDPFWIALSFCGDEPTDAPGQWVVSVSYDPGLNLVKRLFHKADQGAFRTVRDGVWQALGAHAGVTILAQASSRPTKR
jgi:hypothetical protein